MIDTQSMPFLADIVRHQAKIRPQEIALWFEDRETSFAALDVRSNQVANRLISAGGCEQSPRGICSHE